MQNMTLYNSEFKQFSNCSQLTYSVFGTDVGKLFFGGGLF